MQTPCPAKMSYLQHREYIKTFLISNMHCEELNLDNKCACGSVVEHCVSSAKGRGFNSQGTHILIKKCIAWMHCKSLWIKVSAKCKCKWTTLKTIFSIYIFFFAPSDSRFSNSCIKPYINGKIIYSAFKWCIHLNLKKLTLMTGFVVQGHIYYVNKNFYFGCN